MDPVSAISVAASVVQFLDLGCKVVNRLKEYNSASTEVPTSLQHISAQLPLLLNALDRVKASVEVERIDVDTRCILRGVVSGCTQQVEKLERIIDKVLHIPGDSLVTRVQKVFTSIKNDDKVVAIERSLQTYIQVLILHRVIENSEDSWIVTEDSGFFELKVKRVTPFHPREELSQRIETILNPAITSQAQIPIYIMLLGGQGVGKTQLAADYCHQANAEGQFQTIFWGNASTTESLCRSLESISDVIRRSKEGLNGREEKIKFVKTFLSNRWHPWLLVLDGFVPGEFKNRDIRQYLPTKGSGAVLFTSQFRLFPDANHIIEVPRYQSPDEIERLRSAITDEVSNGEINKVEDLIAHGADPNCRDDYGWCCIHVAVRRKDLQMVKLLLKYGAASRLQSPQSGETHGHATALYRAAEKGDVEMTRLLLDHEDAAGLSPSAPGNNAALLAAATEGHLDVVRVLVEHSSVDNFSQNEDGERVLGKAAEYGRTAVVKILLDNGANVNEKSKHDTPLAWAAKAWHLETVKVLCTDGKATVNEIIDPSDDTQPPLWHAVYPLYSRGPSRTWDEMVRVSEQMVKFLLDAGADPNLWNKKQISPLERAASRGLVNTMRMLLEHGADPYPTPTDSSSLPPIVESASHGYEDAVRALVESKAKDVTIRDRQREEALLTAAIYGRRNVVFLLLEAGVDINVLGSSGKTPLLHAIQRKESPTARFLIRRGARLDISDEAGHLPLLWAAENGLDVVVKEIITKTKNPNLQDAKGNTALSVAVSRGFKDVVTVLLHAGADRDLENEFSDTPYDLAVEGRHYEVAAMVKSTAVT